MNELMPAPLLAHIRGRTTRLATALRITRADGQIYGLTSERARRTIDGVSYDPAFGLDASALVASAGFAVDNLEMTVADGGTLFTRVSVQGRLWQNARFVFFRYRWDSIADGVEPLIAGVFGNVEVKRGSIVVELRGLQQYLQQPLGMVTSRTCRARFADYPTRAGRARCGLDVDDWTDSLVVTDVLSRRAFVAAPPSEEVGDPNFDAVELGLHYDGVNGGALFPEVTGKTLTNNGVTTSTTQSKFGGSSAFFSGSSAYLLTPQSADFQIFGGNFTVELFAYFASSAGNQCLFQFDSASGTNRANLSLTGNINFYTEVGGSGGQRISASAPSNNTWHHIALVRNSGTIVLYVDGTSVGSTSTSVLPTGDLYLGIGSTANAGGSQHYTGYMDDIRVTKGVARYTANFTPPAAAFEDSGPVAPTLRPNDWYGAGLVRWTTGANAGQIVKVTAYEDSQFTLLMPLPADIQEGDALQAIAGCRHRIVEDCGDKFDNVLNFQGEAHLPGIDALTASPLADV